MEVSSRHNRTDGFLKSLGFPALSVHRSVGHFDFSLPSRRILVIGPMGSGKTEYSARVFRDARVLLQKSDSVLDRTMTGGVDRRKVFFVRFSLDSERFQDYPEDALAYRGGYERCGDSIAQIRTSFELEALMEENPTVGTWIVDEATFYDERLAYVIRQESVENGRVFIFPSLVLNFRKDIFNPTARLLMENSTDIFPLTAYCEHPDCIEESFYTYRYYTVDGKEAPALYFDPLIIIGGDVTRDDPSRPNYCTRCDRHHYLPGKEYTFLILKPLGEKAAAGEPEALRHELFLIKNDLEGSRLYQHLHRRYVEDSDQEVCMNSLLVPHIAEKILMYLFAEQNLLSEPMMRSMVQDLDLNQEYMTRVLADNGRPIDLGQLTLGL